MTLEELKLRRLAGQHLLAPSDTKTVAADLCGVQAQFLSHALHGLRIRCGEPDTSGLVKGWANRGTMHLFRQEDLPLLLHKGRTHFLRPVDTLRDDGFVSAQRKEYFARIILEGISRGTDDRQALKALCARSGMTEAESESLFDPWGGIIRALCEAGQICHKVQEKKTYMLCPEFEPMEETPARLELARRYFTHFGPASLKDAAYFFGTTQAKLRPLLEQLPLSRAEWDGRTYYWIESGAPSGRLPRCIFLAGFDQLMLGYEKTESLFLPPPQLRQIFTLGGIVRPALLVDGTAAGRWELKSRVLRITLFAPTDRKPITDAAEALWNDLKKIEFL